MLQHRSWNPPRRPTPATLAPWSTLPPAAAECTPPPAGGQTSKRPGLLGALTRPRLEVRWFWGARGVRLREGAWEPWSLKHAFLDWGRALPRGHLGGEDRLDEGVGQEDCPGGGPRPFWKRRHPKHFVQEVGPRTLSQQWGPHPSHHLRMLRGACIVLGVSGLEWSEASRRAVETPDHPFCRAAAEGAVRCVTALWGSMGNSSALERVRSSLTASPWPCEGHPRALGSRWAEDCVGVGGGTRACDRPGCAWRLVSKSSWESPGLQLLLLLRPAQGLSCSAGPGPGPAVHSHRAGPLWGLPVEGGAALQRLLEAAQLCVALRAASFRGWAVCRQWELVRQAWM